MYELSRDLFRALRPGLITDPRDPARPSRTLLTLCEESVARIARTPAARRLHATRLFTQARALFPPNTQLELVSRIERAVENVHQRLIEQVEGRPGGLLRCAAMTRRNTPCMREPIPGLRHCPSHRHLEQTVAPRIGMGAHPAR